MKLTYLNQCLVSGMLLATGLTFSTAALSIPPAGQCEADSGIKSYSFTFNSTFTDPAQNIAGKIIENAAGNNWNSASNYIATCGCSSMTAAYITATSSLPRLDHNDGTLDYFVLNDYLAVGSKVWIAGKRGVFMPVPFTNESNKATQSSTCISQPYLSGARGQINLYFRRPFVGQSIIPGTKLLDVYVSSTNGVNSTKPVSTVSMSGTVTVPQNCEINPQPVTISFGDILSGSFATKGEKPKGFTPVNKVLTLACRNISEGVKISLSFQGTPDPNEPTALKSSNGDIAVKIEDSAGAAITPQSGRLPINLDYVSQSGITSINLYPINTTGNTPSVGSFNATATIRAEIE
jgi:type 1 fimbria pilin